MPDYKKLLSTLILASLPLTAFSQPAELLSPFSISSRHPLVEIYGLPDAQSAQLLPTGYSRFALQTAVANNFSYSDGTKENIFIDGETRSIKLTWQKGISDDVELGLSLPYLSHSGGQLDGLINDWHDLFSLPDANRPDFPSNQLQFSYRKDGQLVVSLTQAAKGIGDLGLNAGYQLAETATRQWALRSQLKLPTGDPDKLLGSGSTDLALSLNLSDRSWLGNRDIVIHASTGGLWMNNGEVLASMRKNWVIFGSFTLGWRAADAISLKLQLDGHSAFYHSALTQLGDASLQLSLGGAVKINQQWTLELGVSEDVAVDTAPDVTFLIELRRWSF